MSGIDGPRVATYEPPTYPEMVKAGGWKRLAYYLTLCTVLITPMFAVFVFGSESWAWFVLAAFLGADAASARLYWRYRAKTAEQLITRN